METQLMLILRSLIDEQLEKDPRHDTLHLDRIKIFFPVDVQFLEIMKRFIHEEYVTAEDSFYCLTSKGMEWSDRLKEDIGRNRLN